MRILKRFDGGSLFAGANSAAGFVSFYETILFDEEIERIYILKGGPGTGKSRFMKDAALLAVERGFSVERYSCSSDPDSLTIEQELQQTEDEAGGQSPSQTPPQGVEQNGEHGGGQAAAVGQLVEFDEAEDKGQSGENCPLRQGADAQMCIGFHGLPPK